MQRNLQITCLQFMALRPECSVTTSRGGITASGTNATAVMTIVRALAALSVKVAVNMWGTPHPGLVSSTVQLLISLQHKIDKI